MHSTPRPIHFIAAAVAVVCLSGLATAGTPVKVFILAGQSNMVGHGKVETGHDGIAGAIGSLLYQVNTDPTNYGHLVDGGGEWAIRDDVWISSTTNAGKKGNLTTGFGTDDLTIGPELGFGNVLGDHHDEQVLLIKTAWGGKSLAVDFRPPSSGGTVGYYYTEMINTVNHVLDNLRTEFPNYEGQGYQIVGFGWHQGWNDRIDGDYVAEYEENMANFINDVRTDLDVPDLPFVLATTGMTGWGETNTNALALMDAQLAIADPEAHPEFEGNVAAVDTRDFWREADVSPSSAGYHWNTNGETYYLIGDSMGEAMKSLAYEPPEYYPPGDLNLDEVVDELDWMVFIGANHTDLSGLTEEEAYLKGDLDGDGKNDINDFILFRKAYETANPAEGAFDAMLLSVPEPTSMILLAFGAAALAVRRRRRSSRTILAILLMLGIVSATGGTLQAANPVIYEPFDYATGTLTGKDGGTGFDGAWSSNIRNGNVIADNLAWGILQTSGGHCASNAWSAPYRPIGTDLADAGLLANGSTLWFSYMQDVYGQNMTNLDYSFALTNAPFDNDYGTKQDLKGDSKIGIGVSNWRTDVYGAYWLEDGTKAGVSERHHVDTGLKLDAGSNSRILMVGKIEWGATGTDPEKLTLYTPGKDLTLPAPILNSWETEALDQSLLNTVAIQWKDSEAAMDEIRFGATYDDVLGEKPILTLQVDPVTGDTSIIGNAARTVTINYYQITSEGDSLDSENWVSLTDQDFEESGASNGTGDGWEEAGGAGSDALAEAFLLGDSTIGTAQTINLGKGYDADVNAKDLVFKYRADPGVTLEGLVEYATSAMPGDANLDGVVDAADYIALKKGFGTASGAKYGDGDFNLDGQVDLDDIAILAAYFGEPTNPGESPAIPEPATLSLMAIAGLAILRRRRTA